ncbi:tail fiber domain-containing protein [Enterobacter hormaechei]|uniref:tail fiber domain-containing protein n=1 Tax=Enterobacter hormaechei TaxID=158836 RepID=UPI001E3EC31E|nr:tail fiber domain-containing protein [Enterobacter hormaechei]
MSNIFTGNKFKLFYNTDTGNRIPDNPTNVQINELSALPTLTIRSSVQTIETYDSDYAEKLLSEQDVSNIDIQVNYIATDVSHKFLDNAATSQETFQLILQYVLEDNQLSYSTVNGSIAKTSLSGDKDSVITKTYSFVPTQMIARMALAEVSTPVVVGMYGLGANGNTVPQYQPLTPDGNAFVKIPAAQAGNPASADMMGVGLVDGTTYSSIAVTKAGTLSLYAKNANTAWTRILTAPQISAQYVPLTRTVNGKPLSANIVLDKSDIGLGNVTNDAQLKIASNLSDLANTGDARTNLDVYSKAQVDNRISPVSTDLATFKTTVANTYVPLVRTVNGKALTGNIVLTKGDVGLGNVTNDAQLKIASNLSDLSNPEAARNNIGLSYVFQNDTWSQLYSPNPDGSPGRGAWAITVAKDGSWGVRNKNNGTWQPLALSNGGTGATSVSGVKTNLELDRFVQFTGNTQIRSPNGNTRLTLADNAWSVYDDNAGVYIPLGISSGGTGATSAIGARNNLFLGEANTPTFNGLNIKSVNVGGIAGINLRPYGSDDNPKTQIFGLTDGSCQIHCFDASGSRKRFFFADQYRNGTTNADRTILTNGDFGVGAGGGSYNTPSNHGPENAFIAGSGLTWMPTGAGFQSSYDNNRTGQMVIQPNNNISFRWIQNSSETAVATAPYTLLQNAGTSDINFKTVNGDLDVKVSLDNINLMNFVNFYYNFDENKIERRGVIAQQIENIDPEYVHDASHTGKMTLDLNPLVMDSLAAIQYLSKQNEEQQTQIDELKDLVLQLLNNSEDDK